MAERREPNFRPNSLIRDRSGEGGGGRNSSSGSGKQSGPNFFRGDSSERRKLNAQYYKGAHGMPPAYPSFPQNGPHGVGMPPLPYGPMMAPPPGYAPYPFPYPHPAMMAMQPGQKMPGGATIN